MSISQRRIIRLSQTHFGEYLLRCRPGVAFQRSLIINSPPRSPTLSYIRLKTEPPLSDEELHDRIRKTVSNKHELQVMEAFLVFNKCVFLSGASSLVVAGVAADMV